MAAYADTSFLASLYLRDTHLDAVRSYLAAHRVALPFTSWQEFELRNAVRLAVFRELVTPATAKQVLAEISADLSAGNLDQTPLGWSELLHAAEEISQKHTAKLGVRALDLLHVSAALTLGAKTFLTLDVRQHALAKAVGLRVGPSS